MDLCGPFWGNPVALEIVSKLLRGRMRRTMNKFLGFWIVAGGICLIVIGLLVYSGGLNWFGRLPGDIRYEGERTGVYIPIVSMLLVSLALSLIFYLIRKFF